jgi:cyclophilin family peptidyl-prolyl cis-trans isomerase
MEAPQVQIDTSMGSFTVELYYKHAPLTVKNFNELAKRGYYDGTKVATLSCWQMTDSPAWLVGTALL